MVWYFGNYDFEYIVCVDDGHGVKAEGHEATPGKRSPDGILENLFNYNAKMFLLEALKRCGIAGYDVSPEKWDNSLTSRVQRANSLIKTTGDKKRIIYISIHFNAYNGIYDNKEGGIEIYHYPGSVLGKQLATDIYSFLIKGTKQVARGVKSAKFKVIADTLMPAVLSENGFMDKKSEAILMTDTRFQQEVAEEHCQGICKYFNVKYIPPKKEEAIVRYKVQVGAFANQQNAQELCKRLQKDGYNAIIIKT